MSDDRFEGMSDSARSLLRSAGAPRPRTGPERARTTRQVARIAATPVVAGGLWLSWKGALLAAALVAGGVGVAVARRDPAPSAPPPSSSVAPRQRPAGRVTPAVPPAPPPAVTPAPPPAVSPAPPAAPARAQRTVAARPARSASTPAVVEAPEAPAPAAALEPSTVTGGGGASALARPVESELERVERARSLLRSDPAEALRVVEGASGGGLAEEREVIAVEALHRLGRTEATRSRAEAFLRRWPRSLYAERVRRWLVP